MTISGIGAHTAGRYYSTVNIGINVICGESEIS